MTIPITADGVFEGCRVLVVEDVYLLAADLVSVLEDCGASVVGPVASVEDARTALMAGRPQCAILDVNLRGDMVYQLAAILRTRGVPFVFATGYDTGAIDPHFHDIRVIQKPYEAVDVVRALGGLLADGEEQPVP